MARGRMGWSFAVNVVGAVGIIPQQLGHGNGARGAKLGKIAKSKAGSGAAGAAENQ